MGRMPCCSKVGLNRGAWTEEEDQILCKYIRSHGEGNWRNLPINAGLKRCGKSCRLRWMNYLRPEIKRGNFSEEEEDLIIRLHNLLGNRWSLISKRIPGRTDNEIKNYWNTHLSKKLLHLKNDLAPPVKICKTRKPKACGNQKVETARGSSSMTSEKAEKQGNSSEAGVDGSLSSWEEILRFECFGEEENNASEEANMLDLQTSDTISVDWIARECGCEGAFGIGHFCETEVPTFLDAASNDLTVFPLDN